MSIIIKSLSKTYSNNKVLNDINLTFNKGKIHGVIGENGAGKTTLFKCIAGIEKYDNGIVDYTEGILKNQIGFLPTNPFFLSKITGLEYLQLLCNARGIKLNNIKTNNIFDLPLKQYATTYSTGMKKKLALTGILIQKNEVFILDEPFNGVDIQSNILIKEIIFKLKQLNKIIIISSHIFSILSEVCDKLYYLKQGSIIKSVEKNSFNQIENEMKEIGIMKKINELGLIYDTIS